MPEAGSLKSEPGYPIQVDAVFLHGSDYIRPDPDQRHVRLEVSSLMRDAKSGAHFRFDYRGTGSTTGPAGLVLSGSPEAKTTEFGEVCKFFSWLIVLRLSFCHHYCNLHPPALLFDV